MKIGIDIDGVVANFVEEFLPKLNDLCNCEFHQIISHDFEKNVDSIDKDLYKKLWSSEVTHGKIFSVLKPIKGSKESLEKLMKHHEIHLITSRPSDTQAISKTWLKQNEIPYTKLEFAINFKDKIEKMSLCDIIVEDELEVARMIASKGIPVILFDYPWNRIDPNIKRVRDWIEATSELERLAAQVSTQSRI